MSARGSSIDGFVDFLMSQLLSTGYSGSSLTDPSNSAAMSAIVEVMMLCPFLSKAIGAEILKQIVLELVQLANSCDEDEESGIQDIADELRDTFGKLNQVHLAEAHQGLLNNSEIFDNAHGKIKSKAALFKHFQKIENSLAPVKSSRNMTEKELQAHSFLIVYVIILALAQAQLDDDDQ